MPTGQYIRKVNNGFKKGHPFYRGGEKGWFKKGVRNNPEGEFKKGHLTNWTEELKEKARESKWKDKNPNWQGDNVGYSGIHLWLVKEYGKPNKCENPRCEGISINYEWAKLVGKEYKRKRENFWQLCKSCHHKYDIVNNNGR